MKILQNIITLIVVVPIVILIAKEFILTLLALWLAYLEEHPDSPEQVMEFISKIGQKVDEITESCHEMLTKINDALTEFKENWKYYTICCLKLVVAWGVLFILTDVFVIPKFMPMITTKACIIFSCIIAALSLKGIILIFSIIKE